MGKSRNSRYYSDDNYTVSKWADRHQKAARLEDKRRKKKEKANKRLEVFSVGEE